MLKELYESGQIRFKLKDFGFIFQGIEIKINRKGKEKFCCLINANEIQISGNLTYNIIKLNSNNTKNDRLKFYQMIDSTVIYDLIEDFDYLRKIAYEGIGI